MAHTIDTNRPQVALVWDQINWNQTEKTVQRLQHRIFMAKVRGDVEAMKRCNVSWFHLGLPSCWLSARLVRRTVAAILRASMESQASPTPLVRSWCRMV